MPYSSTTYTLLQNLSERISDKHTYIDLLFSGLRAKDNDALLSLIRTSGLSPRGRIVDSKESLLTALSERSWDLVICVDDPLNNLSPDQIVSIINDQARDLPVIQLTYPDTELSEGEAIQNGITYLIEREEESLILSRVLREYQLLGVRKRLHKVELALEQALHCNNQLLEYSGVAYATVENGQITEVNPSFRTLFSLDSEDALPSFSQITRGEDFKSIFELVSQSTTRAQREICFQLGEDSSFNASVELTEIHLPDRTIKRIAIDPLSTLGLKSRATTASTPEPGGPFPELEQTVDEALAGGHDAVLAYLALNPTGTQHQTLSKEDTDKVIRRLCRDTKASAVTQIDATDFALIYQNLSDPEMQKTAEDLVRIANAIPLISMPSKAVNLGLNRINDNSPRASVVLDRARQACLLALDSDESIKFYRDDETRKIEISTATNQLQEAIRGQRLKMLYQPLVKLDENNPIHNFEILVRMYDDQNRQLIPAQFMQSLEHANVMVKLDRWVVENALLSVKTELDRIGQVRLFINIARRTLRSKSFVPWLATQLAELEIKGEILIFEVSETDVAADIDFAKVFSKAVRRVGCAICIKHFGCSTNSEQVFESLSPEFVKLDGSFIQELNTGLVGQQAVSNLLKPTRNGKTRVIAPLIEEVGQLGDLYRIGIDLVQGYYLQPPQPTMDYEYFGEEDEE